MSRNAPRFHLDGGCTPLERLIRNVFDRSPGDPLTCKQLATRLGRNATTVQGTLSLLIDEGYLVRRKSYQATRPYEYIRHDATWPSNELARIAYRALQDAKYRGQVRAAIAATAE